MATGGLACILTPAQGNRRPPGVAWCADNGAFGRGYPGDDALLAWLAEQTERELCRFAVAPDVVADHQRTYRRADPMLDPIRALGYPVAFVLQNGATAEGVPWDRIDAVFVGGDTEWKLGRAAAALVAEAKVRGKWAHMGRVNSLKRCRYASAIGCDSVDGTILAIAPDRRLPEVRGWIFDVDRQGALFDGPRPGKVAT